VADTPQTTSVIIYIAPVHRKRFVYIISLNQPKYTVDDQGSARLDLEKYGADNISSLLCCARRMRGA